jgi:hypothetical protein
MHPRDFTPQLPKPKRLLNLGRTLLNSEIKQFLVHILETLFKLCVAQAA